MGAIGPIILIILIIIAAVGTYFEGFVWAEELREE